MTSVGTIRCLVATLTASSLFVACSSSVDEAQQSVTTTAAKPPTVRDVKPEGTPQGTVLRLRRLIGDQAFPLALEAYDQRVIRAISESDVLGALSLAAPTVSISSVRQIHRERNGARVALTVDAEVAGQAPTSSSYILLRRRRHWSVVYDSILNQSIAAFVQNRVQQSIDPRAKTPSPVAVSAGAAASGRFQRAAIRALAPSQLNPKPPRRAPRRAP